MVVLGRSVLGLLFQLNAPAFIHEGLEGKARHYVGVDAGVGDARDAWVRCAYFVTMLHAHEISLAFAHTSAQRALLFPWTGSAEPIPGQSLRFPLAVFPVGPFSDENLKIQ